MELRFYVVNEILLLSGNILSFAENTNIWNHFHNSNDSYAQTHTYMYPYVCE